MAYVYVGGRKITGGWIYIFMTSSDYGRSKIGETRRNPLERYVNLRTADPTAGLFTTYFISDDALYHHGFASIKSLETYIHSKIPGRMDTHDETRSEFFKVEAEHANFLIEVIFEELEIKITDWQENIGANCVLRADNEKLVDFQRCYPD
jgi:hypothetical protein